MREDTMEKGAIGKGHTAPEPIRREQIEELLKAYLPAEEGPARTLLEAMNYSVLAGGKRLRPQLMGEAWRLFGGDPFFAQTPVAPFMAAMEMIHTYSLVHDDLPALDNDTLRRGHPTTWSRYGEAMGVLAGDALLTYAFETAAKAFAMSRHPERVARALMILAEKSGPCGMAGGQALDTALTGQKRDEESLFAVYTMKTAALIEAPLMIGAVLAGAVEEDVRTMEAVGRRIGLAFQIRDDLLDEIATAEALGKDIGSDARNGKTTYVTLFGRAGSEQKVTQLTAEALRLLETLPREGGYFRTLLQELKTRGA